MQVTQHIATKTDQMIGSPDKMDDHYTINVDGRFNAGSKLR